MPTPITATELRSFYAGLILSDGTVDKGVSKRAYTQKTINKDFADYIKNFTDTYTNYKSTIRYFPARIDKNKVNHKEHWGFIVKAHPYFAKLYHLFYDDYRTKYLNPKVLKWIDHRGLANWYMSDGYVTNVGKTKGKIVDCRVEFCNDCFTLEENEIFCEMMRRLGYTTRVVKRGKFYRSRVSLYDAQKMFVDIYPFVVPSMRYKLFMNIDRKWFTKEYEELKSDILAQGLAFKQV